MQYFEYKILFAHRAAAVSPAWRAELGWLSDRCQVTHRIVHMRG
jgi:hypothetical protein